MSSSDAPEVPAWIGRDDFTAPDGTVRVPAAVPSAAELAESLSRIAQAAAGILGVRFAAIVTLSTDGVIEDFVTFRSTAARVHPLVGRAPTKLLSAILEGERPLRIDDLADDPITYAVPDGAPAMRSVLGVPVRTVDRAAGAIIVADKLDGGLFTDDDERILATLTGAVGATIENARLYDEMSRRQRWLEASNEVTTTVLSGASTDDVLALIGDRVRECTPADGVAIMLMEADGRMVVEFATGEASELFNGMVADDSWVTSTYAMLSGTPHLIADLGGTGRSAHPAFRRLGPCMLLPLKAADHTLGAIAVANYRGGRRFEPIDLAMAEAFAGQTAVATVLAEARGERERLAVFEERDRIARDLHDLVIQRLFATGMILQGVGRTEPVSEDVSERTTRAIDELDATVREIRQTIFALNHPAQDPMGWGLRARILQEVTVAGPALGYQPHLRISGAVDTLVPEEVATQMVAALREALSNVARHAKASTVDVEVDLADGWVSLDVVDDGIGIADDGRRSGLRNLALRAAGVGGGCTTEPGPGGRGTRLSWRARVD